MISLSLQYCERFAPLKKRSPKALGFSLLEVMMIITMLSLTVLPVTLTVNQLATQSRGAYVASSRNLQINSLIDSMDAARPDFASQFSDGAMVTTTSESGQTLPYWRKVDVTNVGSTNTLKRTTALYTYNNTGDASSASRDKLEAVTSVDSLRLRFGNAAPIIDSSGNYWYGDGGATPLLYSSTIEVPGAESVYSIPDSSADIVNTSGNDDEIYKFGRNRLNGTIDNTMIFKADVPVGWYIVKIYMAEHNAVGGRSLNFYLNDMRINTRPYEVREVTGGYHRANVQMFETYVADGTLKISIKNSDDAAYLTNFLRSISIMKKKG